MKKKDYLIAPIFGIVVVLLFVGAAGELVSSLFSKEKETESESSTVNSDEIATVTNA